MILTNLSILEWVIIGLGALIVIFYITYTIYRKKHPKKKKVDDEDD